MEGLACQSCKYVTTEFTILDCDHVVCAECLWSEVKTSLQGINFITCPCGLPTTFPADSKETKTKTHKKQAVSLLVTDLPSSSVRAFSDSRSSINQAKPRGKLDSQLQFLEVQLRRSLEEAERNFERVVRIVKEKYENLITSIKSFWNKEIEECEEVAMLDFPTILAKKYDEIIGTRLKVLNEGLIDSLTAFRTQTNPRRTLSSSVDLLKPSYSLTNKQNSAIINSQFEKQRLLKTIQEMKKRAQGIRKTGRRDRLFFTRN